jgi:Rieske Fe-S protein
MRISRREFLILTATLAAGCQSAANHDPARTERIINAGPMDHYARDGVYPRFRNLGFFIVRQGEKLFALSSFCTHRKCKLDAEPGRSFSCPCHGSTFSPGGQVTHGPAQRDLPVLPMIASEGQLLVTVPAI